MKIKKLLSILVAFILVCVFFSFDIPKGWYIAGTSPDKYDMGIDIGAGQNGHNAATIKSIAKKVKGFGTLMQDSKPDKFFGKRVRMSGYMKTSDVNEWAGLWMRVDQCSSNEALSFDNMANRRVIGNTGWTKYDIVLDVPLHASNIAFGAMLVGTGQIWFENISFEVVDNNTPCTGQWSSGTESWVQTEPSNLNFEVK